MYKKTKGARRSLGERRSSRVSAQQPSSKQKNATGVLGGPPNDENLTGSDLDPIEMYPADEVEVKVEGGDISIKLETDAAEDGRCDQANEMEQLIKKEASETHDHQEGIVEGDGGVTASGRRDVLDRVDCADHRCFWRTEAEKLKEKLELVREELVAVKVELAETKALFAETTQFSERVTNKRPRMDCVDTIPPTRTGTSNIEVDIDIAKVSKEMTCRPKQEDEIIPDFVIAHEDNSPEVDTIDHASGGDKEGTILSCNVLGSLSCNVKLPISGGDMSPLSPPDPRSMVDTVTCRLVHFTWLDTINKCLKQCGKPLVTLTLPSSCDSKALEKFNSIISEFSRRGHQFLEMILKSEYFQVNDFEGVFLHLHHYTRNLVRLEVEVPVDVRDFGTLTNSSVHLPLLQTLEVRFGDYYYPPRVHAGSRYPNAYTSTFVQIILTGSQNLERFNLVMSNDEFEGLPDKFEELRFPDALTHLTLDGDISYKNLKRLLRSPLPKLAKLVFRSRVDPFNPELVSNTIARCSDSISRLILNGLDDRRYCVITTSNDTGQLQNIESPRTVEVFTNFNGYSNDGYRQFLVDIPAQLPALRTLKLCLESCIKIETWIGNADFKSIENLDIVWGSLMFPVSLPTSFCQTFSNLRKLNLKSTVGFHSQNVTYPRRLDYVLQNLPHLEFLQLRCHYYLRRSMESSKPQVGTAHWWILLTHRISSESKAAPTGADQFLNLIKAKIERQPEVTVLQKLKKLHLYYYNDCNEPFDDAFHFGFYYMSRLQEIRLEGKFEVSPETAEKWKESDRLLEVVNS